MLRFIQGLFLIAVIVAAPAVFAADTSAAKSSTAKAPTCLEKQKSFTSNTSQKPVDTKTAIQQTDKYSSDTVVVVKVNGKVQVGVTSECNQQCIGDKIRNPNGTPSTKPCPPGKVTMTLPNGIKVTCSKEDDACGKSIQQASESSEVVDALNKGDYGTAAKSLAKSLAQNPGFKQAIDKSAQGIIDAAYAANVPAATKGAIKAAADGLAGAMKSLSAGDIDGAVGKLDAIKDSPALQEFLKDPANFKELHKDIQAMLPPGVQESLRSWIGAACSQATCPKDVLDTFGLGGGVGTAGAASIGATPLSYGPGQKIDEREFAQRAAYLVSQSGLAGKLTREDLSHLGITTGATQEWVRLFTMLCKAESNCRTAQVHSDGSLVRFPSTPRGEQSYGPLQFKPGEYGLRTWADVNNPDKVIGALINVAERGNMHAYFGSIQRPNEVLKHSKWYDGNVAKYVDGTIPFTPTRQSYASTFGGGSSPFSSIFGGSSSGFLGGITGGGGSSPLTSAFSSIGKMFGMGGGSSGGASRGSAGGASSGGGTGGAATTPPNTANPTTGTAPAINASPTAPTTPSTPAAPTTPVTAFVQKPVIALVKPAGPVAVEGTVKIIWAATQVSQSPVCKLYEVVNGEKQLRKEGNTKTYTQKATTAGTLSFELICVPLDTKADLQSGVRAFTVSVQ